MELRKRSMGLIADISGKDLKLLEKSPSQKPLSNGTRSRTSSTADADMTQKLQRHNDIAEMIERDEIVPLISTSNATCDMCDGLWADESASALFEFRPSGIICDQSCLHFSAMFIAKHPSIQCREDYLEYRHKTPPNQSGVFKITVEKAVDLPSVRWVGRQDPYVRLALLPWNEPVQTKASISGGKNPSWTDEHMNEMRLQHRCQSSNNPVPTLELQIWNENYMMNDDLLASSLVSTAPLLHHPNVVVSRWYTVASRRSRARIYLSIQFEPQSSLRRLVSAPEANELVRDHRFRVHSLKSVGICIVNCAVCERIIISTTKAQWGYRCEDCGLDVHKACMMVANTNLPCPNQDTSDIDTLSPSSPRVRFVYSPRDRTGGYRVIQHPKDGTKTLLSFGKLYVNLQGIHLCSKLCKGNDQHALNVYEGDTYCRLSVDGLTHETKEIYKSHDPVFDDKTCFIITHRDATFQLDLIDLSTNIVLGSMQILLFELLQMDSDDIIKKIKFQKIKNLNKFSLKLKNNIIGYININIYYKEEKEKLLLYVPKQKIVLQGREEKEFAVETLKKNMERMARLLQLGPWIEQQYIALITWKNPTFSAIFIILFTFISLFFNSEYIPALFFYIILIYMCHTFILRINGNYLEKWIAWDEDLMENSKLFRPIATLRLAVLDGILPPPTIKNDQFIFVKIFYMPNDADQEDTGLVFSGGEEYLVGRTHAVRYNNQPKWRYLPHVTSHLNPVGLYRPNTPPKKEYVFRNVQVSWPHTTTCRCLACSTSSNSTKNVDYHTLIYPLLQAAKHFDNGREILVPWISFPGLLRFDVISYSQDLITTENLIATTTLPLIDFMDSKEKTISIDLISNEMDEKLDLKLTIRIQIELPLNTPLLTKTKDGIIPANKKWSNFVSDALAEKDKTSTFGTAFFGAFWKAKDTTKMVQNAIGRICGTVVCTQNLFNWTHPWKTGLIFVICLAGAILFSFVPARYIILVCVLLEFLAGLRQDRPPSNTARNILWNFISSLPTDMDLIQAYDDQREIYLEKRNKIEKIQNEICRRYKFQCLWIGIVLIKTEQDRLWKTMCVAYRPFRFIFWKSMEDADSCHPPLGQIIIDRIEDIKEIPDIMARKPDEPPNIFYVLGNTGDSYQEKRFFGFSDQFLRDELLNIVKKSF